VNPPPLTPSEVLHNAPDGLMNALQYPFFQAVFDRKSRRVGLGMQVESDILDFASDYEPVPLSELEEALLCIAGTGLTGLNLGDLDPARGMSTLVQWTTRTWPSSCSNHGTELFYTNDDGLYLLDMFDLVPEPGEVTTLSGRDEAEQVEVILAMYRRARTLLPKSCTAPYKRCQYTITTAKIAPDWMAMSNTLAASPVNLSREPARIRWPVDEIGRNSVRPSTIPMTAALTSSKMSKTKPPGVKDAG